MWRFSLLGLLILAAPSWAQSIIGAFDQARTAILQDYDTYTFIAWTDDISNTFGDDFDYRITWNDQEGSGDQIVIDWTTFDGANNANCDTTYYYCTFAISELSADIFQSGDVTVDFTNNGGTNMISTKYTTRSISQMLPSSAFTAVDATDINVGYDTTNIEFFDTEQLGYDQIPMSINVYDYQTSGEVDAIKITYDDSEVWYAENSEDTSNGNLAELGSGYTFPDTSAGDYVSQIILYRTSSTGGICGIVINGSDSTSFAQGCTGNSDFDTYTYTSTSDWFVGFVQYTTDVWNEAYMLYPIAYSLMNPRIAQYTPRSDGVDIWLDVRWPTSNLTIEYDYMDPVLYSNGTYITSSTVSVTTTSTFTAGYNDILGVGSDMSVVPCSPVTVTIYDRGNTDRHFEMDSDAMTYNLYTAPWYNSEDDDTVLGSELVTNSSDLPTYTQYTNNFYYDASDDNCMINNIWQLGFDSSTNTIYANGMYLGSVTSDSAPTNAVSFDYDSSELITSMTFYYNMTEGALYGFTATTDSGMSSFGTVDGVNTDSQTFTADSDEFIMGLQVDYDFDSMATRNIRVYYGYPIDIVLTSNEDVDDDQFYTGNSFSAAQDADLQRLYWYTSADYRFLNVTINGYFLDAYSYSFPNTYLDFGMTNGMTRGMVYSAIVRHLVADTDYTINSGDFEGIVYTDSYGGVVSTNTGGDSGALSWTQPDGVQWACDGTGEMRGQIEYEAVPEVAIAWHSATGPSNTGSTTTNMAEFAIDQYDNTENYFQYGANEQLYPRYQDFFGYPTEIMVYWNTGDDCIEGLYFMYQARNGSDITVWLAGSQSEFDALSAPNQDTLTMDLSSNMDDLIESVSYDETSGCISGIMFTKNDGDDSGCMGPSTTCDTLAFDAETALPDGSPSYYLYSLDVDVDSDGETVYGFDGEYVSVNIPTLVPIEDSSSSCYLDENTDWAYIRDFSWYLDYALDSDNTECGTEYDTYNLNDGDRILLADQSNPYTSTRTYAQRISRMRDDNSTMNEYTDGTGGLSISRFNDWQMNGFCYYDADGQVSSYYETKAEDMYNSTGFNELDQVEIYIYYDSTYTTAYDTSTVPVMYIGDPVYVRIESDYNDYVVSGRTCWASETSSVLMGSSYYTLSDDGCQEDSTWAYDSTASSNDMYAFQFDAFAWYSGGSISTSTVYLHCNYRLCPTEDISSDYCSQDPTCISRAKRDLSSQEKMAGVMEHTVTSKNPLVFLQRRDTDQILQIHRDPWQTPEQVSMFAGFAAFVVTMLLCSIIFVSYRIYRVRKAFNVMQDIDQHK